MATALVTDLQLMSYTLMAGAVICGLIALLFILAGLVRACGLRTMCFTGATFASILAVACASFYALV